MRLSELEQWLTDHGFRLDRVKGSHRHWKHATTHYRVTISAHGNEVSPWQVKLILRDIEQMHNSPACITKEMEQTQ